MNKCAKFMGNFAKVFVGSRQRPPRQKADCLKTWENSTFLCSSAKIKIFYLNDCFERLIWIFADNVPKRQNGHKTESYNILKGRTIGHKYHCSIRYHPKHPSQKPCLSKNVCLGFYPWSARWPNFDHFVRLVIRSGTTVVHNIYFKRVEVVFERGGGSQVQAQYPQFFSDYL